jgi:hypothetical protein
MISYLEVLEENLNTQNYVYLKSTNKIRKIIIAGVPLYLNSKYGKSRVIKKNI